MHTKFKTSSLFIGFFAFLLPLTSLQAHPFHLCSFSPWCNSYDQGCEEKCQINVGFEGLYWTIYQSDLEYAVDFDGNNILGPSKTHFLTHDWRTGVRGWIGWDWGCDWNTKVVGTYFKSHPTDLVDKSLSATNLKASLLHPSTGKENANKATADLQLKYKTVDLLFSRELPLCDNGLMFQSFFGVRALRIEQEQKVLYEGEDFGTKATAEPARVKWDSDLDAVGLHAGMDWHYSGFCGIQIYGSFAGSILTSETHNHHKQQVLDKTKLIVTATQIDLKEKQHIMLPGYHLTGGISWDMFCANFLTIRVKVGYEYNKWFDTPQLRRYDYGNEGVSHSGSTGSIGLHGLTVATDFYF